MVLYSNKFIFIHIPKTSGSSFTKMIKEYLKTNKKTRYSGRGWQGTYHFNSGGGRYCNGQHTSINDLNKEDRLKIANLPIITIVRNPYSWLVSVHEHFFLCSFPTFKEFILNINKDKNFKIFGKLLQTEYIKNTYNYKVEIYKFEENPHENICKKYNLKYEFVHELNRNRNKKIKEYYDNELINIVNNIFVDDFTYLNYKMVTNISELNF